MEPAVMHRRDPLEVLQALQAALAAVPLPPGHGQGPLFEAVRLYDLTQMDRALTELLLYQERVACVVPGDESFRAEYRGRLVLLRRDWPVSVLISDRRIGDRTAALWGDGQTIGVVRMVECTLPYVTGQLLRNPAGVRCVPVRWGLMTLSAPEQPEPGRAVALLDLSLTGGRIEAQLDQAPIM